jgi:predicted MPP superfamily phosphohydrolase
LGPVRTTRRRFLRAGLSLAGGVFLGLGGYATLYEPNEITLERVDLELPRLPPAFDGLKIAQLSDLHYKPFTGKRQIGAAVEQVNRLQPDLVFLTGDFVTAPLWGSTHAAASHIGPCARLLAPLRARSGVFAVLGNHDVEVDARFISESLAAQQIRVLRNESHPLERESTRLWIAGLDDCLFGRPNLDHALARIPRDEFTILLVHEPDFADQAMDYPVDLQISGHSHGGQVRFPLVGAPYLPAMARKYPWGLYRVGKLHLYSNRGIGAIGLPVRFGSPPEVTLLTLRTGNGGQRGS